MGQLLTFPESDAYCRVATENRQSAGTPFPDIAQVLLFADFVKVQLKANARAGLSGQANLHALTVDSLLNE